MAAEKYEHFAVSAKTKELYEDCKYLLKKRGEKVTQESILFSVLTKLKNELEATVESN